MFIIKFPSVTTCKAMIIDRPSTCYVTQRLKAYMKELQRLTLTVEKQKD